jgi:DNA polymerase-3 subunit gamma/tau
VRELTESLRYGPARDRYKVVVLDEVHRLSRQAFDALLKIVEEPPPHIVFVFATTEVEAVPATILSRCQEYHFRRVPAQEVAEHLRAICAAEGLTASDTALRLIARAGEGSVRDAVALLDQLATFGSGRIADDDAARLVGGLDTALFARLLGAILAGRAAAVVEQARRVSDEGWDPRQVFAHFLAYCREALHLALGAAPEQVDLPREEAEELQATARRAGYENLLRLLHQLLQSEPVVRKSEAGALAVEIAWLRAAELPKLVRVEELLAGGAPPLASPPVQAPARPPAAAPPGGAPAPRPAATAARAQPAAPPRPAATPTAPRADGAQDSELERLREGLSARRPNVAAHLEGQKMVFADGELRIYHAPGDTWLRENLQRDANRQALEETIAEVFGPDARFRLLESEAPPAPAASPEPPPSAAGDPTVQTLLDIFGGTVERVEPRREE